MSERVPTVKWATRSKRHHEGSGPGFNRMHGVFHPCHRYQWAPGKKVWAATTHSLELLDPCRNSAINAAIFPWGSALTLAPLAKHGYIPPERRRVYNCNASSTYELHNTHAVLSREVEMRMPDSETSIVTHRENNQGPGTSSPGRRSRDVRQRGAYATY